MSASSGEGDDPRPPDQTPIRRLFEVGVFAPLGFLLEYRTVLPKLTEAGRRQVDFTRSLGRAALRTIARGTASTRSSSGSVTGAPAKTAAVDAPTAGTTAAGAETELTAPIGGSTTAAEVAGYGAMTARDIIALVGDSDVERVEWIAEAEAAGKARVTVLRAAAARLARLQGDR